MSVVHLGYKSACVRSARYKSRAIPAAASALGVQAKAYMYVYIEHMYTKWAEVLARCHL